MIKAKAEIKDWSIKIK